MKKELNREKMILWAKELFPICRSITGNGLLETLKYLKKINSSLTIYKVRSGTKVYDWNIPDEWNIEESYLEHESGKRFAEFKKNNLHVVNYSAPVNKIINLKDLKDKIYSDPKKPKWIPYVTSYYNKKWGFCMSHNEKQKLPKGEYRAVIKSKFSKGHLYYGDILIKGKLEKEILFSTYVCHPSMANNELSGPVLSSYIARYIKEYFPNSKYSYRFIFVPETIGAITYIKRNINKLKKNVIAGYVLSCVGDERAYSMIKSRNENSLADQALYSALKNKKNFKAYSYLDRGSDERQYCAPGVDLPVAGFCRSKYGEYPEYHTSADNFNVVTAKGLSGSFDIIKNIVDSFENSLTVKTNILCEPNLGKRGLYSLTGGKKRNKEIKLRCDLLSYADGNRNIFELALLLNVELEDLIKEINILKKKKLIF
tara:strand:- start:14561 stop:15841 length:1281 start_codon:yes stop_codon:yes gene_type:complete